MSALDVQVGGDHYKKWKIQPVEYIHANGIPFIEGCIIKYASRWRDKGGIQDLEKIKHFVDLLIDLETRDAQVEPLDALAVDEPALGIDDDSPRAQILGQNGEMAEQVYAAIYGKPSWDDAPAWAAWLCGDHEGHFWAKCEPEWYSDGDERGWKASSLGDYDIASDDPSDPYKEPRTCQ